MSEQEKYAIAGKTLLDYAEAKRTLGALKAKASEYSGTLRKVAMSLHRTPDESNYTFNRFGSKEWNAEMDKYPARDALVELAREIASVEERKRELFKAMKEMGYEPKESD